MLGGVVIVLRDVRNLFDGIILLWCVFILLGSVVLLEVLISCLWVVFILPEECCYSACGVLSGLSIVVIFLGGDVIMHECVILHGDDYLDSRCYYPAWGLFLFA